MLRMNVMRIILGILVISCRTIPVIKAKPAITITAPAPVHMEEERGITIILIVLISVANPHMAVGVSVPQPREFFLSGPATIQQNGFVCIQILHDNQIAS